MSTRRSTAPAPELLRSAGRPGSHLVELYDEESFLVGSVREFLAPALRHGEAAIVIATPEHRDAFERALTGDGLPAKELQHAGRLVLLDAAETLGSFLVDGMPDRDAFVQTIAPVVEAASRTGTAVRAYGEMVALLWADGNVAAAVALEDLWNELAQTHAFSLLCAYPLRLFDGESTTDSFRAVCDAHTHVVPSERYATLWDTPQLMREVALLEQAANAGAHEANALRVKQAQLEEALLRLEQATRSRNEFIGMVVHDIRSPATVVTGFLEVLRSSWQSLSADEIDDLLERTIVNSKQIKYLADDVLTVSALNNGEFRYDIRPFDLAEVVYRTVGALRDEDPEAIVEVVLPPSLPRALGDSGRQMQILGNILSNAVKYSPPGAVVRLQVEVRPDALAIAVRDVGAGIEAADVEKLFQPFVRLRPHGYEDVKGTGLGLYITKALVEAQGGTMIVETAPDHGSTFTYTVPIAR